jgi:hypothetical protein
VPGKPRYFPPEIRAALMEDVFFLADCGENPYMIADRTGLDRSTVMKWLKSRTEAA